MKITISLVLLLLFFNVCSNPTSPDDNPDWLITFLNVRENENTLPQEIWQYKYLNETVYYVISQCCDQFNILLDKNGNTICAPDGGITGKGDGQCPDFFEKRKNGKLIWKVNSE